LNYLVHLFLAEPSPESLLGNLMGDFVKGRLGDEWPPAVRAGIERHRRIDRFAQTSPSFRRSKTRLDPALGHYRGILVDVFYDHFLARNWERHHAQPLPDFARHVYRLLAENLAALPPGLQTVAPRMIAGDWLVSYREVATVGRALERMSLRLRRPNPLAAGAAELSRHYAGLAEDCERFLAEAQEFIRGTEGEAKGNG
jgi:acyl carrier protein phosphodiesterase